MTTITPSIDARRAGGFTLTELIVAAVLSALILAGVLSMLLMVGRTAFRSSAYSEAEAEVQQGLETFAEDVRQATDIHWNSSRSITLTLPTATNATRLVTYAYDEVVDSPTYHCFYRLPGDADSTAPRQVLVHDVAPDFAFQRYKLDQTGAGDSVATNDLETKQIQLNLRTVRVGATAVAATQNAVSARLLLRNKRVSD